MGAQSVRSVLEARGEQVLSIDLWAERDQLTIFDCTTERGFARLVAEPFDPRLTVGVKVADTSGTVWSVWPFPHDSRIPGMAQAFLGTITPFTEIRPEMLSRYFPEVPRCVLRARDRSGRGFYVKCYGDTKAYETAKRGHELWDERMEPRGFTAIDEHMTIIVEEIVAHTLAECFAEGHVDTDVEEYLRAATNALVERLAEAGLYYADFHRHNVLVTHTNGEHRVHLIDLDSIKERGSPRKLGYT